MGYMGCNLAEGNVVKHGPPEAGLEYSISHKTWKDLLYALNDDRYLPMEIAISGYI